MGRLQAHRRSQPLVLAPQPKVSQRAPKIVFSDLDGSFLTSAKTVHPVNQEALRRLALAQIPFVTCSGRPLSSLQDQVSQLGCRYLIASNGANIYDCQEGRTLFSAGVDPAAALALMDAVSDMDVVVDLVVDGCLYSQRDSLGRYEGLGVGPESLATHLKLVHPVDEPLRRLASAGGAIDRMGVWYGPRSDFEAICAQVDALDGLRWIDSEEHIVEMVAAGVSKGAALMWLCEHLGVDRARSVAFGNGGNDIEMLEAAGDGVALCNSQPQVPSHANHLTARDNDQGGCGLYLLDLLERTTL